MKLLIFLFFVLLTRDVFTQKTGFVRVYGLNGNKINKGEVVAITDTSLQIKRGDTVVTILVNHIGSIKTKRAAGNNVIIGSTICTAACVIIFVASADPDNELGWNAGEGAAGGVIIGAPLGAAIGGITVLFKNSKTYLISGDATKWKAFQSSVTTKN